MKKLKVIPGRGLSGRDLKRRLNNRTAIQASLGPEHYTLDEQMTKFTRMSRTEQVSEIRRNNAQIKQLQDSLSKQAEEQDKIRLANKIEEMAKEKLAEIQKQSNPTT